MRLRVTRSFLLSLVPLILLAAWMFVVPLVFAAPAAPGDVTTKSCAFGNSWTDTLLRVVSGGLLVLGLLIGVIVAIFRRMGEGGGVFAGAIVMASDYGGAILVLAMVSVLAGLLTSAVALTACP